MASQQLIFTHAAIRKELPLATGLSWRGFLIASRDRNSLILRPKKVYAHAFCQAAIYHRIVTTLSPTSQRKDFPAFERLKSLREQRSPSRIRVGGPSTKYLAKPGMIALSLAHGETKARTAAGATGRLSRCHVALDRIFKEFRVRLDVQRLHHPILVKGDGAGLYVDYICHFFHRHPFRQ